MAKKKEEAAAEGEEKEEKEDKKDDKKEEKDDKAPEGEAAEGAEGEAAAAPKKSKKKLIIIIVAAIVVLGGAGAGVYFSGILGKHEDKAAVLVGADGKPIEKPIYYNLPEFLVNLNSPGKQSSFLKASVILEVAHQTDVPQIEANLPRLVDSLNTYLRELRPSDLAGSAGIQRLREELLLRANKTLDPVKINDVLFKEIVVQ